MILNPLSNFGALLSVWSVLHYNYHYYYAARFIKCDTYTQSPSSKHKMSQFGQTNIFMHNLLGQQQFGQHEGSFLTQRMQSMLMSDWVKITTTNELRTKTNKGRSRDILHRYVILPIINDLLFNWNQFINCWYKQMKPFINGSAGKLMYKSDYR